ncbi:MAG: zf-HC2 domain-containing protein [Lachnospiraceae bacterium]|nr:zf-HC2 domain-containing protein [Lachnospiraceae bacterium]
MDHKTFEKLIPDFLQDRLDNNTEKAFLEHYDHCRSCREELSIQFLVYAGLPKLETGETFHLQNELNERIEQARETNLHRKRLGSAAVVLEILTFAAAGTCLILWMAYR